MTIKRTLLLAVALPLLLGACSETDDKSGAKEEKATTTTLHTITPTLRIKVDKVETSRPGALAFVRIDVEGIPCIIVLEDSTYNGDIHPGISCYWRRGEQ